MRARAYAGYVEVSRWYDFSLRALGEREREREREREETHANKAVMISTGYRFNYHEDYIDILFNCNLSFEKRERMQCHVMPCKKAT